jgi:3-deoxy-manno-octulosonate cytidylyltransferase (CMP-KDO synthetase)
MTQQLKYGVIIPARYKSSRFPGKPLIDLCGKPMIQHVWERCVSAVGAENVYIATDSDSISAAASAFGAKVIMTSEGCKTGTDRIAEANIQLDLDFVINVQGDEPLINPSDILAVRDKFLENPASIVNAYCKITEDENIKSLTIPKVVVSKTGRLLYMSRSAIPGTKDGESAADSYKQVCIYAFSREHLSFFYSNENKTRLEAEEDIEILRFLENDYFIKMIEVNSGSIAVDIPADVELVSVRLVGAM